MGVLIQQQRQQQAARHTEQVLHMHLHQQELLDKF
jgi:hypothetical protein